jgi:Domain of unknown function (DUF5666)
LIIALLALVAGGVVWAAESGALPQLPSPQQRGAAPAQAAGAIKPGRLPDCIVHGTVTAVEDDEALIKTNTGLSVTLIISGTTIQWVPGQPPTRTVKLVVGDPVLAFGPPVAHEGGQKVLIAHIILVVEDLALPKYLIRGQVVVATQQTIVVDTGQRQRAVTVLPRTRFWWPERPGAPRDIGPGDTVIALGQPNDLGQWIAGAVVVPGTGQAASRGLAGRVTAIDLDAGTLTVQTAQRGQLTVVAGADTRYRLPNVKEPALASIKTGDLILATGRFEQGSQTRFLARVIRGLPASD